MKLNGALTSGENIADIGGVKLGLAALRSWQKAHPAERRSVEGLQRRASSSSSATRKGGARRRRRSYRDVAQSDPHAPPQWRVNGPIADVPAFAQAYQCKAATPMNPGKVCAVW